MSKRIELAPWQRFARLVVIENAGTDERGNVLYRCQCDCGNEKLTRGQYLRSGQVKSCGCLSRERIAATGRASAKPGSGMRRLLNTYQNAAKRRGIEWRLSDAEFANLTSRPCFYCGAAPSKVIESCSATTAYVYTGLDRVDNERRVYIMGNVVPCCTSCNQRKRTKDAVGFINAYPPALEFHRSQMQQIEGAPA